MGNDEYNPLPKEIELKTSGMKCIGLLSMSVVFTLIGIWMLLSGDESKLMSWLCIVFFGVIGIPVFLLQLIRPGRLYLNEEGFEQVVMGRRLKCDWRLVSEFDVTKIKGTSFISFSRVEDEGKVLADVSKIIAGGHSGILADTFGMKAPELAELLNTFRDRALNK